MKIALILASLIVLVSPGTFAKRKLIHLVTIEAPPFMGENLPEQGAGVYAFREVFKKMGYDLKVSFAPLPRTKKIALDKPEAVGFAPSTVDDIIDGFTLSKVVYETPWVIVERKDNPIHWKTAEDLAKYRGGNVHGYSLRADLRKVHEDKKLILESAADDARNLMKLANKRIDYVFIDAGVFQFLTSHDDRLKPFRNSLQINAKPLDTLGYGIAFKKDPTSQAVMEDFNKKVNPKDFTTLVDSYIREMSR